MSRTLAGQPLVCAIWLDAHGTDSGEYTVEDIRRSFNEAVPVKTFGLLVCDDERGVTIAQEITTEDHVDPTQYRGLGFIPRAMLQELIVLGVPKRPAKKRKATKTV